MCTEPSFSVGGEQTSVGECVRERERGGRGEGCVCERERGGGVMEIRGRLLLAYSGVGERQWLKDAKFQR